MPRAAKKNDSKTTTASKAKKTTSKKSSKKTTQVVQEVAAPVANTVVEETPVAPEVALANEFTSVLAAIQEVTSKVSALRTQLRALEKKAVREVKAANKRSKKGRKSSGTRTPSGFVKPTLISEELASFLSKPKGTEMARTEVTKEINAYIRANKLQDPKNGRIILADAKLSKLLSLKKDDELTYFNLQKYMSPHFAKAGSKAAVSK
uniref:DM2 domain-containing protein n=1 Tax=viral metagenome TaxID=1070528 RepID=A0A6C0CQ65_9ZZZZ